MAVTNSTMKMELGAPALDFSLPSAMDGRTYSLRSFQDARALVIIFASNHCPFVRHIRLVIGSIADEFLPEGVAFVAINSNDIVAYPDDSPEHMKTFAAESGWVFPYLFDETQEVAKAYRAACTPDLFVFDHNRHLAYRGQIDETRPDSGRQATGDDLRRVLDDLLDGKPVPTNQKPSIGCGIKWKAGNEPGY